MTDSTQDQAAEAEVKATSAKPAKAPEEGTVLEAVVGAVVIAGTAAAGVWLVRKLFKML